MFQINGLLIYHSAVGSTRLVGESIKESLKENKINVSMLSIENEKSIEQLKKTEFLIIGFPTFHCKPSPSIEKFIHNLPKYEKPKYAFIFTTCGWYSANTLLLFYKLCLKKNIHIIYSRSYRCPASDSAIIFPKLHYFQQFERNIKKKK